MSVQTNRPSVRYGQQLRFIGWSTRLDEGSLTLHKYLMPSLTVVYLQESTYRITCQRNLYSLTVSRLSLCSTSTSLRKFRSENDGLAYQSRQYSPIVYADRGHRLCPGKESQRNGRIRQDDKAYVCCDHVGLKVIAGVRLFVADLAGIIH